MHVIFGTPRGGTNTSRGVNTARGGPAFTPRGTLVALSQAGGKAGAALSLGMPLKQAGIPENSAAEDAVNMGFAKDWVTQIFATPRGHGGDDDGARGFRHRPAPAQLCESAWQSPVTPVSRGRAASRSLVGAGSAGFSEGCANAAPASSVSNAS